MIECLILFGIFFWFYKMSAFKRAPIDHLAWGEPPGMIALAGARREGRSGILFVKLRDGKEQFIAGDWNASFTDQGNIIAFGSFPMNYSEQIGQQIYYIGYGSRINDIQLNTIQGKIFGVTENRKATYLLVQARLAQSTFFCVAERVVKNQTPCVPVGGENSIAAWNPDHDREIVIKNPDGSLFLFDPWENELISFDSEKDPEQTKSLTALLAQQEDPFVIQTDHGEKRMRQIGNIVIIRGGKSVSWVRVPFGATARFIRDDNHLLVKEDHQLSVVERSSKKVSVILKDRDIAEKDVIFRNGFFDERM